MTKSGYIYVLANPSSSGVVKIGKTRQSPVERAKELSSASGVPAPFIVVYHVRFNDCTQAEQLIHARLEKFRISNNREFFQVDVPVAVNAVIDAKNILGCFEDEITSVEDNDHNVNFDSIDFGKVWEPERGLYELLDMLINHSMHSWNDFVKRVGLSMPQFSILIQLYYRGHFSISEISDRFGISVPAASQLVEKLVQAGYLGRVENPKDGRARLLHLSTKGNNLIEQGFKSRYRWLGDLIKELTNEEHEKVTEALKIVTEKANKVNR